MTNPTLNFSKQSVIKKNRRGLVLLLVALSILSQTSGAEQKPIRLNLSEYGDISRFLKAIPAEAKTDSNFDSIFRALAVGYSKDFIGVEITKKYQCYVLFGNDQKIIFYDGQNKTFSQKLDHPDLRDTFSQEYSLTNSKNVVKIDFDPGRFRVDSMFMAVYGKNKTDVEANCEKVSFFGNQVLFNRRNGAAAALRNVETELENVFRSKPELRAYTQEIGGTLNWRKVAGSEHLSSHSFGVAIDLNSNLARYWRWDPENSLSMLSSRSFPQEIIEAFEHYGFIWGGKWYHYDTMHFEYRPELIAYSRNRLGIKK